jgi:hypothetical protein
MANLEKRVSDLEEIVSLLKNEHPIFRIEMTRDEKTTHNRNMRERFEKSQKVKKQKFRDAQRARGVGPIE